MTEIKFLRPICPQGHDKRIVGTYGYSCKACAQAIEKRRRERKHRPAMQSPFCINGHDKRIVGTTSSNNGCRECARVLQRRYARQKRAQKYDAPVILFGAGKGHMSGLRRTREMFGLSRPDLERLSGVSRNTITDLERGRSRGWPTTRKKLIDALAPLLTARRKRLERAGIAQ